MECVFYTNYVNRINVSFDNSWLLVILENDKYSLYFNEDQIIHDCSYEKLLNVMEHNGIRKQKQCEYKDAEIYIVDFEN